MMESDSGKLFVGGISWDTNEDRLREYFGAFGVVVEAMIMKDRITGRARGFGFVVFADPGVAEHVVLQKHMIDGRMVEAKKAVPRDDQQTPTRNNSSIQGSPGPGPGRTKKIFVGGLPSSATDTDFKKYFDQFGTITDVVIMYDHSTQRHRGFGFITYASEDAVDRALFKTFHELNGKMVEVKRAVPKELSPVPNMRSPINSFNFGLDRMNSIFNGYNQGYNPSLIGSYGMRMDGRLGQLGSARNGFPSFDHGYGIGMNFEPGMNTGYGENSTFNNNLAYARSLSPYINGISSRYNSPIGYGGVHASSGPVSSSGARNLLGMGNLNYKNSANSNAYMPPGNGGLNWGGPTPSVPSHGGGSVTSYAIGSVGYPTGENSFNLGAINFRTTNETSSVNTPLSLPNVEYERNLTDLYGSSSIYGDSTWRPASPELGGLGPFGYGLGNAASDVTTQGTVGYIGGYNGSNSQPNRGIAT